MLYHHTCWRCRPLTHSPPPQEECEELKMGGFLSVQKGSAYPPQFIHMTYKSPGLGAERAPLRVALVGKGLTFDSGGYNLKVRISM